MKTALAKNYHNSRETFAAFQVVTLKQILKLKNKNNIEKCQRESGDILNISMISMILF